MRISPTSMYKKVACAAVIALSLWLGGFGCSFCCATGVTDSCCQGSHEVTGNACGLQNSSGGESCCKSSLAVKKSASSEAVLVPIGIRGCSLLPAQLASLSATQRISGELVVAADISNSPIEVLNPAQAEPFIYPPVPRNRGATYLRCCVLLI
jgi:hypothetical protein